jgi:hypothetical protein
LDNVKTSWWRRHKPSTRRLIQLYSALLHNAHLKGFISGQIYQGKAKYACVPGFNCYSCPSAAGACPLGAIQNAFASTGHRAGWYVLGIILLFGVVLGRTICGWLCPLGLIQELLNKIPTLKIRKGRVTRALSWLKYVLLAVFVIALPLWYGRATTCRRRAFASTSARSGLWKEDFRLFSPSRRSVPCSDRSSPGKSASSSRSFSSVCSCTGSSARSSARSARSTAF